MLDGPEACLAPLIIPYAELCIKDELYLRKFFESEYETLVAETGFDDIDRSALLSNIYLLLPDLSV